MRVGSRERHLRCAQGADWEDLLSWKKTCRFIYSGLDQQRDPLPLCSLRRPGLRRRLPAQRELAARSGTIAQVKVYERLVANPGLLG